MQDGSSAYIKTEEWILNWRPLAGNDLIKLVEPWGALQLLISYSI